MTLGRTSSGAIKIKTDGGLRAVECACCGDAGCGCVKVSDPLKSIIESSTTVSTNGGDSYPWTPDGTFLFTMEFRVYIAYSGGILCVRAEDEDTISWLVPDGLTFEDCKGFEYPAGPDVIIINGQTFAASNYYEGFQINPTPNIVFS